MLDRKNMSYVQLNELGMKQMQEGKTSEAIDSFTLAINKDPTSCIAYCSRAGAYEKQHNLLKEIADYRSAIALDQMPSIKYLLKLLLKSGDKEELFNSIMRVPTDQLIATLLYATAPSNPQHDLFAEMYKQRGSLPTSYERGTLKKLLHELDLALLTQAMGNTITPAVISSFKRSGSHTGNYLAFPGHCEPRILNDYLSYLTQLVNQDRNIAQQVVWLLKLKNINNADFGQITARYREKDSLQAYLKLLDALLLAGMNPTEIFTLIAESNNDAYSVVGFVFLYQHVDAIVELIDFLIKLKSRGVTQESIHALLMDKTTANLVRGSKSVFEFLWENVKRPDIAVILNKMLDNDLLPLLMKDQIFNLIEMLPYDVRIGIMTRIVILDDKWHTYFQNEIEIRQKVDSQLCAAQVSIVAETAKHAVVAAESKLPPRNPEYFAAAAPSAPPVEIPAIYPSLAALTASALVPVPPSVPVLAPASVAAPASEVHIIPVVAQRAPVSVSTNLFDDLMKQKNNDEPVVEFPMAVHIKVPRAAETGVSILLAADLITFPDDETAEEILQREKIQQVLDVMHTKKSDAIARKVELTTEELLYKAPPVPETLPSGMGVFAATKTRSSVDASSSAQDRKRPELITLTN